MSGSDKPAEIFHSPLLGTCITGHHDVISHRHMIYCRCDLRLWKKLLKADKVHLLQTHIIYWNKSSRVFPCRQVSHWPVSLTKTWHHSPGLSCCLQTYWVRGGELESCYKRDNLTCRSRNGCLRVHTLHRLPSPLKALIYSADDAFSRSLARLHVWLNETPDLSQILR